MRATVDDAQQAFGEQLATGRVLVGYFHDFATDNWQKTVEDVTHSLNGNGLIVVDTALHLRPAGSPCSSGPFRLNGQYPRQEPNLEDREHRLGPEFGLPDVPAGLVHEPEEVGPTQLEVLERRLDVVRLVHPDAVLLDVSRERTILR
jgi:hypothetical protein